MPLNAKPWQVMMRLLLQAAVFYFGVSFSFAESNNDVKNLQVIREVFAVTPVLREICTVQFLYAPSNANDKLLGYHYNVHSSQAEKLAHISAKWKIADLENPLEVHETTDNCPKNDKCFIVKFDEPLKANTMGVVIISTAFKKMALPEPPVIIQGQTQILALKWLANVYSHYETVKQQLAITFPNDRYGGYIDIPPTTRSGNQLIFGPFTNIPVNEVQFTEVFYEHQIPLVTIERYTRIISLPDFTSNFSVEEHFELVNDAADAHQGFSKTLFIRDLYNQKPITAYAQGTLKLLQGAHNSYVKDRIGYISTSTVNQNILHFRTRYPLAGSWKAAFFHCYTVPLVNYSMSVGKSRTIRIPLFELFDDMIIEDFELKIKMPEGAFNIQISTGSSFKVEELESEFGFLDLSGHAIYSLRAKNLSKESMQMVEITYEMHPWQMLQKPLTGLVTLALLMMCIVTVASFMNNPKYVSPKEKTN